ncbi:hypothetical protein, partial [Bradyrhizobium liaoningense]|uniref:hypothetical protein n=1 Tax=Bradyrhizobium liaoningense TaxID=43992 RepID=UPI001BA7EABC
PRVQHNPAGIHLNPAGRCPNNRGQLFSGEPHLLQPIQMLEISRKGCPAHSAREQAFVGHLLRPLSALRLNARNLTLRAAM